MSSANAAHRHNAVRTLYRRFLEILTAPYQLLTRMNNLLGRIVYCGLDGQL